VKKILVIFIAILFLFPINTFALSNEYNDVVAEIVNVEKEEDKINLYLFYSLTCPHCHEEMDYIENELLLEYGDKLNVYKYEVTRNKDNNKLLNIVKSYFRETKSGVPFTVIGEKYILGFGDTVKNEIEYIIDDYLVEEEVEKIFNIPLLGDVSAKDSSLALIAVILGFIDGFNPCAMWILLLLINMTLSIKDRKKLFLIGLTFILTGGIIYFLSMLGIGFVIDLTMVSIIRNLIAIVAIILGIYNLYTYVKTRKNSGCHVVDKDKRKGIINKINNILSSNSLIFAVFGTIILAVSVNLVELACSLGFPTIYLELLSINGVVGLSKIWYLLIYILFYLIDDFVIFLIAVFTLQSKGISTKYNKLVNLIGGILMILMGILLIIKPEWVMFNF